MIESQYITEEAGAIAKSRLEDMKHRLEGQVEDMKHRYEDVKDTMRRNPGSSIVATLCTGVALGLFVGLAWTATRRQSRAQRLLGDIEDSLRDFSSTPISRARSGLSSFNKGLRGSEAQLEDLFHNLRSRFASLFS